MARASLITKGLADATGDLERTIGSTVNQGRKFAGTMKNLSESFGTLLLPAVNAGMGIMGEFAAQLEKQFGEAKATIAWFADSAAADIAEVGRTLIEEYSEFPRTIGVFVHGIADLFGTGMKTTFKDLVATARWGVQQWGGVIRNLPDYAEIAVLEIKEKLHNIGESFRFTRDVVAAVGSGMFDHFTTAVGGAMDAAGKMVSGFAGAVLSMGGVVGKVFDAILEANMKIAARAGKAAAKAAKDVADAVKKDFAKMIKDVKPPEFVDNGKAKRAIEDRIKAAEQLRRVQDGWQIGMDAVFGKGKGGGGMGGAANKVAADLGGGTEKGPKSFGIADFARDMQARQLGGDNIPQKQLDVLHEIAGHLGGRKGAFDPEKNISPIEQRLMDAAARQREKLDAVRPHREAIERDEGIRALNKNNELLAANNKALEKPLRFGLA